jgi:TolB protein
VKTLRLNHLGEALLAVAAAGLLAAVGLVVFVYAQPAEATFPGKPGKIAYSGVDTGTGNDDEIYTIKPGGGGKFNVTDNVRDDIEASYSPSGKRIAYAGYDGTDYELYTINATGGGRVQLTDNNTDDDAPAYSPSGKKIVYSSYDGTDYELYKINAGGGGKVQLTDNNMDDYSSYSPDGKKIALSGQDAPTAGDYEIFTINAGGGG